MEYRTSDPVLAYNGLSLLQALLSEVPVIENFIYFSFPQNVNRVNETIELLGQQQPLNHFQKYFLGTAALLAGNMVLAEQVEKSLTKNDLNFRSQMRNNEMPVLYWFDFVELNYALKHAKNAKALFSSLHAGNLLRSNQILENEIKNTSNARAKQGLLELFATLNAKVDWMDYRHFVPMWVRIANQFSENKVLFEQLLKLGLDTEKMDSRGYRPLYYAMIAKDDGAFFELLLKYGADPNQFSAQRPLLALAARYNYAPQRIRKLLEKGADPNALFDRNFRPLHVSGKNLEATKLLIEFKADVNAISGYNQTPLDLAEKYGTPEVVEFLRSKGAKRNSELKRQ